MVALIRYRPDRTYRRVAAGRAILGGSPLRIFRLTDAGQRVADAIERGETISTRQRHLADRLAAAGAIHPLPAGTAFSPMDVTIVRPVWNGSPLPIGTDGAARTIWVDDGSDPALGAPEPVELLRLDINQGPAASRNAGLAAVDTELVAFVDADVAADPGWLDALVAHFDDPRLALVAPRVASAAGSGVIARYEQQRSPLDLGPQAARIAPQSRVSYVPAAALVCRVAALREIGGFDTSMRAGEDVDLVWRLVEAGWTARYEPAAAVHHLPRADLRAMLRQRATYGGSAAVLEAGHPGALPLRLNPWTALSVAALAVRCPLVTGAVVGASAVTMRRRLANLPWQIGAGLAVRGHAGAARAVAAELTRSWLPLGLVGLAARRSRPAVVAAVLTPPLLRWAGHRWRAPNRGLDPLRTVALSIADDVAYGVGVWRGALCRRSLAAILPRFGGYRSAPS